jgi:hypothetical protein
MGPTEKSLSLNPAIGVSQDDAKPNLKCPQGPAPAPLHVLEIFITVARSFHSFSANFSSKFGQFQQNSATSKQISENACFNLVCIYLKSCRNGIKWGFHL